MPRPGAYTKTAGRFRSIAVVYWYRFLRISDSSPAVRVPAVRRTSVTSGPIIVIDLSIRRFVSVVSVSPNWLCRAHVDIENIHGRPSVRTEKTHVTRRAREARPVERVFHGYRAETGGRRRHFTAAAVFPTDRPTGPFSVRFYVLPRIARRIPIDPGTAFGRPLHWCRPKKPTSTLSKRTRTVNENASTENNTKPPCIQHGCMCVRRVNAGSGTLLRTPDSAGTESRRGRTRVRNAENGTRLNSRRDRTETVETGTGVRTENNYTRLIVCGGNGAVAWREGTPRLRSRPCGSLDWWNERRSRRHEYCMETTTDKRKTRWGHRIFSRAARIRVM